MTTVVNLQEPQNSVLRLFRPNKYIKARYFTFVGRTFFLRSAPRQMHFSPSCMAFMHTNLKNIDFTVAPCTLYGFCAFSSKNILNQGLCKSFWGLKKKRCIIQTVAAGSPVWVDVVHGSLKNKITRSCNGVLSSDVDVPRWFG